MKDKDKHRFWKYVEKSESCWNWIGYSGDGRYGRMKIERKQFPAHRVSWMIHKGPIPTGMFVCHSCDNTKCVNPDHLWLGTAQDNSTDMVSKGRQASGIRHGKYTHPESAMPGERNPKAKLSRFEVDALISMRNEFNISLSNLGRMFGIGKSQTSRIIRGLSWNLKAVR